MDNLKFTSVNNTPSVKLVPTNMCSLVHTNHQAREEEEYSDGGCPDDADINLREVYFLMMHFLSAGPCQRTFRQLCDELVEHDLLPRRYHAWFSRNGVCSGEETDDGISFPLHYGSLIDRYSHIQKDHLIKLLKQLVLTVSPSLRSVAAGNAPGAADVPTLLGTGSFSLLSCHRDNRKKQVKHLPSYLRWPHMQADQLHALSLREIGGGFSKHHRAPSIRLACYAIAKPSTMVQKMQLNKKLRGHRDAVYCAIFDRSGRYIITGSDDRLVKIWSMETAFCLASCRGHVVWWTTVVTSTLELVLHMFRLDLSLYLNVLLFLYTL
ncbi:hypothetical protein Leryth_009002 [Lithospermum erythrorhizon]|nr:hypothetical protein Leryth_009002 [Lithospermum erythrorhizon]